MTLSADAPLRVGFIGTGWTDRVQIPAFRLGGLIPQAIASGNPENARRVAQRHGIPQVFERWEDLVHADTVDIVSIVTPPSLHREMAVAALEAGKHVICEKPTARNAAEAEAMLAAAQAAPDQMAIIDHELRFTPQRQHLRELYRENYVGRPLWLEMTWYSASRLDPGQPWTWWSDAAQGGGALGAIGSHLLDLARWLCGRVEALAAQLVTGPLLRLDPTTGQERPVTADDHAHLAIRFQSGLQGAITVSAVAAGRSGMELTLYGTEGALYLDKEDRLWGMRGEHFPKGPWQPIPVEDPVAHMKDAPGTYPFARGSVYLAQAIRDTLSQGATWIPEAASFYDGFVVQKMLDAARTAAREVRWVMM